MSLKLPIGSLFLALLLGGCYAAAWDRDKLDYWSQQDLSVSLAGALPDLGQADEIRVLVFGDSGKPSTFETVAGWMGGACNARCDFALVLGDNFYLRGPTEMDPEKFDRHFHAPLKAAGNDLTSIPFWVVLGNHGYVELFTRPPSDPTVQLAFTNTQQPGDEPLWLMPSLHYGVPELPEWLTLVGFDSMFLSDRRTFSGDDAAYEELRGCYVERIHRAISSKDRDGWRVLFGHHPHVTVGSHADGNRMRAVPEPFDDELPLVYFSGHDHDQQLIEAGGLIQVVQGAASKTRARKWGSRKAEMFYEESLASAYAARNEALTVEYCEKYGFAIAAFREREFDLTFYWGEKDAAAPAGTATWSWRRDENGQVTRSGGGPGRGFTDLCPSP